MKNSIQFLLTFILSTSILLTSCTTQELTEPGLLVPLTVSEDASLPSISVNGTLLHSETFGDPSDPMLIVIHGGPGGDYRSNLNYKDLANDGLFVVFYDQRGSGLSQRHDVSFYENKNAQVQLFIDDLQAVIDYYRFDTNQKVILAGHSWGAMLATGYINQNPELIDGAILSEPGGFTWDQTSAYVGRAFSLQLLSERTNDLVYSDQFITGSEHEVLDYKLALASAGDDTGDSATLPIWRLGAVISKYSQNYAAENPDEMDFTENLSQFNKKILFAYSELNTHYGEEHALLVSSEYPNVQLELIPECGHEIIHNNWTYLYPKVLTYIKEIL